MSLPIIIKTMYGAVAMTGLYSFEFVNNKRQTIFESFLLFPPTAKTVTEGTRASVVPTLSGNYVIDGGNATKTMDLSGEIYLFLNQAEKNHYWSGTRFYEEATGSQVLGLEEFFKLRWSLVRYRDYTMKKNGKLDVPLFIFNNLSVKDMYDAVALRLKKKYGSVGGLYDQLRLIVHDYDMDDHFYCKVNSFTWSQSAERSLFVKYDISLECYDVDDRKSTKKKSESKQISREEVDTYVAALI